MVVQYLYNEAFPPSPPHCVFCIIVLSSYHQVQNCHIKCNEDGLTQSGEGRETSQHQQRQNNDNRLPPANRLAFFVSVPLSCLCSWLSLPSPLIQWGSVYTVATQLCNNIFFSSEIHFDAMQTDSQHPGSILIWQEFYPHTYLVNFLFPSRL